MIMYKTAIFSIVLVFNTLFSIEFLENGVEVFSINSDAQIGAMGGNNPALIGINGKILNNPALGNLKTKDLLSFTYRNHFSGLVSDHIITTNINQKYINNLSFGIIYRSIEKIPNTLDAFTFNGNQVIPIDYNLISYFNHWELASIVSLASKLASYEVGLNIKSLIYSVSNEKAFGLGFDIGLINNINEFVRFGMVMKNFPITIVNWSTNRREISKPQLSLGFNYFKNKTNLASGIELKNSRKVNFNGGVKYSFNKDLGVLVGYNNKFSYSFGIEIKNQIFIINYSYISGSSEVPFKSSHEMTLSFDKEKIYKLGDYINP